MKRYNYIFWDWNGTLSNDVYAALASVNDILARRGRQSIDISRYYSLMATPITLFYERLFAPEKPDFSTLFREYHEGYALHMKEYGLADGAVETLKTLKSSGIRQAVISSSESGLLLKQIRSYGIEDMFDHIIGQDGFHAGSKLDSARDYIQPLRHCARKYSYDR